MQSVEATDATVILASEPLWAALFGFALLGAETSSSEIVGGVLIIAACVFNEIGGGQGENNEGGEDDSGGGGGGDGGVIDLDNEGVWLPGIGEQVQAKARDLVQL